jgi:hypothetical protein
MTTNEMSKHRRCCHGGSRCMAGLIAGAQRANAEVEQPVQARADHS